MARVSVTLSLVVAAIVLGSARALDNGVARTPPMGWLQWERYACNTDCDSEPDSCISENLFMKMADLLVSEGYKDAGYEFVNIDDCWPARQRDAQGRLQADPTRFPHGIKYLADYVHNKGLKLGIYTDFGRLTCGGYPGSGGNLQLDMQTFASWGVDMIKMDGCYADINEMPHGYLNVSQYLNATGRHIVFSCSWPAYWDGKGMKVNYTLLQQSCNLWRNYDDISDSWSSVQGIVNYYMTNQDVFAFAAGPGHWNDPDMLIIGDYGLSFDEQRSQMAIWSVLAAPLLMSVDLKTMPPQSKEILQNADVIAVNQDALGHQGRVVMEESYQSRGGAGQIHVFVKPLVKGDYAVVIYNSGSFAGPRNVNITFEKLGLPSYQASVRDLFAHQDLGFFNVSFSTNVNPSGVVMVKVSPR